MPDNFIIYSKKVPVFWKPTFRKKALSSCSSIKVYEETFTIKATHSLETSGSTEGSSVASQNTATLHHTAVISSDKNLQISEVANTSLQSTALQPDERTQRNLRPYRRRGNPSEALEKRNISFGILSNLPTLYRMFVIFFPH